MVMRNFGSVSIAVGNLYVAGYRITCACRIGIG